MDFSIITPSFRNSAWLKLCIASVADQQGVSCEHIVQDACSDDGTQAWLPTDSRVKAYIEKDSGMYDAINRGMRRAQGDILAYLNCDEQYLPGALQAVESFFNANPDVDVALAGAIVTDGNGQYLCHRHALVPGKNQIWFRFSALTCSIFFRRKVVDPMGIFFDTRWRALGDLHWVRELLQRGVRLAVFDHFTSLFTDDGKNLCLTPLGVDEQRQTLAMAPAWARALKPVWILQHRMRRLMAGHFNLKATHYDIYTLSSYDKRVRIEVPHPTAIWRNRL